MGASQVLASLLLLASVPEARTQHYSWWSDDPRPYLAAIKQYTQASSLQLAPGETIRAGIVTHHFLASGLMVRFFETLQAQSSAETIILIGPDHFHRGLAKISFSSLPWKTPFGIMETDRRIVQQMQVATRLQEDQEAFTGEHSVGVLVPFLKYYFPQSRVVPILVDVNAQQNQLGQLRGLLAGYLQNPRIVVLLSMDFSHNSTAVIAAARDAQAEQAISALDSRRVEGLNVDCRKGLWLLLASLGDLGKVKVQVGEHTNSARLTGNSRQPDVTSYYSVYFMR